MGAGAAKDDTYLTSPLLVRSMIANSSVIWPYALRARLAPSAILRRRRRTS